MILDERNEFCDATAMNTGGAGTYLLGDQIDLTLARDVGRGEPIYLVISVAVLPVSATGTADFKLASDAQAAIATDGSATIHASTGPLLAAAMPAGKILLAIALPMEGAVYERYLGILQTTATAAFSAGAINAYLTHDVALWKAYADASN